MMGNYSGAIYVAKGNLLVCFALSNGVKALYKCFALTQSIDPDRDRVNFFIAELVRPVSVGVIS